MNRKQATDADLTEGTIVYKGNGSTAWEIWLVRENTNGWVGHDLKPVPTRYALRKPSSKSRSASRLYEASDLTIDAKPEPTGMDTLRELLTLDF